MLKSGLDFVFRQRFRDWEKIRVNSILADEEINGSEICHLRNKRSIV